MRRDSGKVIQEKANVLWNVANTISGLYKPHEYGLVILPMAVVKRFHDCLVKRLMADLKELPGENGTTGTTGTATAFQLAERRVGAQPPFCEIDCLGIGDLL